MKKEKRSDIVAVKAFQHEVKEAFEALANVQNSSEEDKSETQMLMKTIMVIAKQVFKLNPVLAKIVLEPQEEKPKRKANKNKTREFIVERKDEKGLELWCVNGVKTDAAFLNVWSDSPRIKSISVSEEPCLGYLYVTTHENLLFEAIYENTKDRVLIIAHDADDAKKMMLVAIDRNILPADKFKIIRNTTIKRVHDYNCSRSMKTVSGGCFQSGKPKSYYNPRFCVLQFDDFRDGKHKEFCSHE